VRRKKAIIAKKHVNYIFFFEVISSSMLTQASQFKPPYYNNTKPSERSHEGEHLDQQQHQKIIEETHVAQEEEND
jgi:hypothetical protein